jgi:hypothetical protein
VIQVENILAENTVDRLLKKTKRKEDGRIIIYFSRQPEREED